MTMTRGSQMLPVRSLSASSIPCMSAIWSLSCHITTQGLSTTFTPLRLDSILGFLVLCAIVLRTYYSTLMESIWSLWRLSASGIKFKWTSSLKDGGPIPSKLLSPPWLTSLLSWFRRSNSGRIFSRWMPKCHRCGYQPSMIQINSSILLSKGRPVLSRLKQEPLRMYLKWLT